MTPEITPFIWYDADPREVRDFYAEVFEDLTTDYEMIVEGEDPIGLAVSFGGKQYILFNGGSAQTQSMAFSLAISADGQDELDRYWELLAADGGEHNVCGWLKDKYGVAWQIWPSNIPELLGGPDAAGRERVHKAVLGMTKLVASELEAAYRGDT